MTRPTPARQEALLVPEPATRDRLAPWPPASEWAPGDVALGLAVAAPAIVAAFAAADMLVARTVWLGLPVPGLVAAVARTWAAFRESGIDHGGMAWAGVLLATVVLLQIPVSMASEYHEEDAHGHGCDREGVLPAWVRDLQRSVVPDPVLWSGVGVVAVAGLAALRDERTRVQGAWMLLAAVSVVASVPLGMSVDGCPEL